MKRNIVPISYRRPDGTLEKFTNQLDVLEQDPSEMKMLFGGAGLYSTLKDYMTFLRHILQIKAGRTVNPLISRKTVDLMFTPSVPESYTENIEPVFGWKGTFGYGLCLATEDWPGRRKKISGAWYGWGGTYFFIDPKTGLAAVYGTQVVPTQDKEVVRLWQSLEAALYEGIRPAA